jgi:predicted  nucleic acid-binding Zn-ribbon protein
MRKLLPALVLSTGAYPMQVNLFANSDGSIQKVYISPHWKIVETIKKENNKRAADIKITAKGNLMEILSEDRKIKQIIAVSEDGNFIISESGQLFLPRKLKKVILYLVDKQGDISLPITLNLQS